MTNEEKLRHFEESVLGRAGSMSEEMLTEHEAALHQATEAYKEAGNRQALKKIKAEIQNLKRESNISVSREQMNIKRRITERSEELTGELFELVKEKLEAYRQTPDYEALLLKQIGQVKTLAAGRDVDISLCPKDANRVEQLSAASGMELRVSEEDFLGGTRSIVDNGKILVDDSFASRLEELRENYIFEGGISHE